MDFLAYPSSARDNSNLLTAETLGDEWRTVAYDREFPFPAGARVSYETAARPGITHQQIWVLQGMVEVLLGEERFELRAGDCLAMVLDRPITYHNPTPRPARYCVVMVAPRPA